jgi:hypothetical protein
MKRVLVYLVARLGEASTYAALAALLAGLGLRLDPGVVQDITLAGTGIAGLAGVLLRDKGAAI